MYIHTSVHLGGQKSMFGRYGERGKELEGLVGWHIRTVRA